MKRSKLMVGRKRRLWAQGSTTVVRDGDTGRVGGGQGVPRPRQNMQVIKEEMA